MSTRFLPPSSVKPLPDCQNYTIIVEALEQLLQVGSTAIDDFAGFLDPVSAHGSDTLRRIRNKIGALPNPVADTLFRELEMLHQNCPATDWNNRLGELMECVFERLAAEKYPAQTVTREKRLEVSAASGVVVTTEGFPMDIIVWQTVNDHGEALEVKKAMWSYARDSKLTKKLRKLGIFKAKTQEHAQREIFVGVATLFDEEQDAMLCIQTMLGYVNDSGKITQPIAIDLLTRDKFAAWSARFYL